MKKVLRYINRSSLNISAAFATGLFMGAGEALAQISKTNGKGFKQITQNMIGAGSNFPGIVSLCIYIGGLVLVAVGLLDLKKYIENPGQGGIQGPASRLIAGALCLALPAVLEGLADSIGQSSKQPAPTKLQASSFENVLATP